MLPVGQHMYAFAKFQIYAVLTKMEHFAAANKMKGQGRALDMGNPTIIQNGFKVLFRKSALLHPADCMVAEGVRLRGWWHDVLRYMVEALHQP